MMSSARQCAAEILHAVLDEKRPLDEALARHVGLAALEGRDRSFARLMVMTVLRRLGQIDALLSSLLEKQLTGKSNDVMHCLRLGVAQLVWLETPPHAAVHAMVGTTAAMGHERMKGLVNAVLMRVVKEGAQIIAGQDEAALNLPGWLYDSWRVAYGEDAARAIARARLEEPPLDITVKEDAAGWAQKLGGMLLPTGSVRLKRAGRVEELPGYAEGAWWVQDTAASLPVKLLGNVTGLKALDLCAAPGGKTAQLAALGAEVTAVDQSARRLALLAANLDRLKLKATVIEADIARFRPEERFDILLLDAPCSATGTMRRHPEVTWRRTQGDVAELAALQRRLLNRAAAWVKPGGRLVYCVCSLQPEEGELQAASFAGVHPGFKAVPCPEAWKTFGIVDAGGALRTHPACLEEAGGMDGFYAICRQRLNDL
jgi:16S rRNA (cytosine967-C5)-methyltransferase